MLADAATFWPSEVNAVCSLRSCDWSHWDPAIYWPKLPYLWQQRHSETVDFLFNSFSFRSFLDLREDNFLVFSSGCLVQGQTFSYVSKAQPRVDCCYGKETVQWEPTATSCLWGFRTVRWSSGEGSTQSLRAGVDKYPAEAEKMEVLQDEFGL